MVSPSAAPLLVLHSLWLPDHSSLQPHQEEHPSPHFRDHHLLRPLHLQSHQFCGCPALLCCQRLMFASTTSSSVSSVLWLSSLALLSEADVRFLVRPFRSLNG